MQPKKSLPFKLSIDVGSGFLQVLFSQFSPIGQSVPMSHRIETSPYSFGSDCRKFGPMKHYLSEYLIWLWNFYNRRSKLLTFLAKKVNQQK